MGADKDASVSPSKGGTLRKVNSETKFAVSLLLAVSGGDARQSVAVSPALSSDFSSHSGSRSPKHDVTSSPRSIGPTSVSLPPTLRIRGTSEEQRAAMQRQAALARFREKKQRRHFHKKVRYLVRKKLAESRPRYKGRFSKPPQADGDDEKQKTSKSTTGTRLASHQAAK